MCSQFLKPCIILLGRCSLYYNYKDFLGRIKSNSIVATFTLTIMIIKIEIYVRDTFFNLIFLCLEVRLGL